MDRHIELLRIGPGPDATVSWMHGPQRAVDPTPAAVASALSAPRSGGTDINGAVLLLDARFPLPADELLARLLGGPADVWHGGLALGLDGQPRMWDHVDPLSMFSAPLDPTIEATSWRVSLRALLVRTAVLEQLGGPEPGFDTLSGSGLEAGLRWIRAGALVRHVPELVPIGADPDDAPTAADGLRVVGRHRGRVWAGWALQQAVSSSEVTAGEALRLARQVAAASRPCSVAWSVFSNTYWLRPATTPNSRVTTRLSTWLRNSISCSPAAALSQPRPTSSASLVSGFSAALPK